MEPHSCARTTPVLSRATHLTGARRPRAAGNSKLAAFMKRECAGETTQDRLRHDLPALAARRSHRGRVRQRASYRNGGARPNVDQSVRRTVAAGQCLDPAYRSGCGSGRDCGRLYGLFDPIRPEPPCSTGQDSSTRPDWTKARPAWCRQRPAFVVLLPHHGGADCQRRPSLFWSARGPRRRGRALVGELGNSGLYRPAYPCPDHDRRNVAASSYLSSRTLATSSTSP